MRLVRSAAGLLAGAILIVLPARDGPAMPGASGFQPASPADPVGICYQCHGPDQNKRKAELRLDRREGLFRSADGTTIVVPGKPDESELVADHIR